MMNWKLFCAKRRTRSPFATPQRCCRNPASFSASLRNCEYVSALSKQMNADLFGWRFDETSRLYQMLVWGSVSPFGTNCGQKALRSPMRAKLQSPDLVAVDLVGAIGEAKRPCAGVH